MTTDMAPSHILCDGVSPEAVTEFASQHGLTVLGANSAAPMPCILVLSDACEQRLSSALRAPVRACFEATPEGHGMTANALERMNACQLLLSLTTSTAYKTPLAQFVSRWISQSTHIEVDLISNLELAIQEALANALIHGNMGFKKTLPDSFHGLSQYGQDVEHRLTDQKHGQLRIELSSCWDDESVSISILDNGAGFDITAPVEKSVTGWGLSLIRKLALSVDVTEGGRKITMRFAR